MPKDGKPLVFLSYTDTDEAIANLLSELIQRTCTGVIIWRSGDGRAGCGCTQGRAWFDDIHEHLESADYVLALVTPNSRNRPWIYWESGIGYSRLEHTRTVPFLVGTKLDDLKPPLSHLQGVDATNLTRLSGTVTNIATDLGQSPIPKDVLRFCSEFVDGILPYIPTLANANASVLSDRELFSEEMANLVSQRLEKKLEELVGKEESPKIFDQEAEITRTPDPQIIVAAKQAIEFEVTGINLKASIARALAENLYFSDDIQTALAIQEQLVDSPDANAIDCYNLGVIFLKLNMTKDAASCFNRAIRINRDSSEAWYSLGLILKNDGQMKDAEHAYREAIRIDQNHASAWYNLGNIYLLTNREEEAEKAYQMTIAANPNHEGAWANLGACFYKSERFADAQKAYNKALNINSNLPDVWSNLGAIYDVLNQTDEAEHAYRIAISIDKTFANAWYNLSKLLERTNRFEEAREAYQRSIDIYPNIEQKQ
ncbi:MAG: toll/interleukin-1 receptor domain-containing protein [Armatimonadota bacterium]|nr:toll/interleukin-1 receptor domain-containing protein [bacterium]